MNDTTTATPNTTDAAVPANNAQTASSTEMTAEQRRDLLRERIEAGERRNEERSLGDYAKETADNITDFAKEHPIATIAGAIGIGLAIGAMTRPGRRAARRGAAKTGALAALASEAIMAFGANVLDGAEDLARNSGDAIEDFGDHVGDRARTFRRGAAYRAGTLADSANSTKRDLTRKAKRSYRDLRHRAKH